MLDKVIEKKVPVSIRQVAETAEVSIATVSRAFNNFPALKPSTRQKVLMTAQELGYTPSAQARALRQGPTDVLGLLISRDILQIGDAHYETTISNKLFQVGARENYCIMPEPLHFDSDGKLDCRPKIVNEGRISGLFVVGHIEEKILDQILDWKLPVCIFEELGEIKSDRLFAVSIDYKSGTREAIQYLAAMGHRRIGFVHGKLDYPSNSDEKQAYLDSIAEFHLEDNPALIFQVNNDEQHFSGGYRATHHLLSRKEHAPTAICYANDWYAVGGLMSSVEMGLRVPDDLSIVGFNNSFIARQCQPALSSVGIDFEQFVSSAIDLMTRKLENKHIVRPIGIHRPRLIPRDSCAPLKNR